ncbi:MAG TPA: hypothetical protein PKE53_13600 [Flavobacteriales bacterium]|jgi:predicted RND superfamily exporter protein|nr:hypothetical protein [Flavobacteriales bacterium]
MWEWLASRVLRNRTAILIGVLVVTVFMGYMATTVGMSYTVRRMGWKRRQRRHGLDIWRTAD